MSREQFLREYLPETVSINPIGENAGEIRIEQFEELYPKFFDGVLQLQKSDIRGNSGYGELDENNSPPYASLQEFLTDTFTEEDDGYWKNWKELFETTMLQKDFFEKYYGKMLEYSKFCEKQRFLVNNNTFFGNMVMTERQVGFLDWSRVAVADWMLDFAIMDLHRPYFGVPEKLYAYMQDHKMDVEHFKERFLCMAYYKGLDVLRWHASIDDAESCGTIIKSISELEDRMNRIVK